MDLPKGKHCSDCEHIGWCKKAYGVKENNTSCDFEPIRFLEKNK